MHIGLAPTLGDLFFLHAYEDSVSLSDMACVVLHLAQHTHTGRSAQKTEIMFSVARTERVT